MVEDAKHINGHARVPLPTVVSLFSPVAKRYPRSSKASSDGPMPRPFWSHPYQNSLLRRSSPLLVPPPITRGPSTKARVRLDRCLQCIPSWMQGSAVDCRAEEWCRCCASRKGLNYTTSVEHVAPSPTLETYHPVPELKRCTADPVRHSSCGRCRQGRHGGASRSPFSSPALGRSAC